MDYRNAPGLNAVLTRSNLCPMSQRLLPRCLLSLLMIWQSVLSVLAHPVSAVAPPAGMQAPAAAQLSAECCPHESTPMTTHHDSHHAMSEHHADDADTTSTSHACDAGCDCHCAGVSALVFVAPDLPAMQPHCQLSSGLSCACLSSPPTSLLRPPIA